MVNLKLRAHHLYCLYFLPSNYFPNRGSKFYETEHRIKRIIESSSEHIIEIIMGTDELCQTCPFCSRDRCECPEGNEEEVRKWDTIILKELGVTVGDKLTTKKLRALIEEKTPLVFCKKCGYNNVCSFKR